MTTLSNFTDAFARSATGRYRHVVLLALLVLLWLSLFYGPTSAVGRLFWLADVAAFLVWQPLVQVDRRLGATNVLLLFAGLSVLTTLLDWGWLALWVLFLAAMVGGKVLVAPRRRDRWFYLLVFFELSIVLLLWISPKLIPLAGLTEHPILVLVHVIAAGVIAFALIVMPVASDDDSREVFDFLTGFFVLLLLAVLLLGTSALMLFRQIGYFEALTLVMFSTAGVLLLVSWWASPRPGHGGIESLLTAYLLRVGFPFEVWLKSLMQFAERHADAHVFLTEAMAVFSRIPWVVGGKCEREGQVYRFGDPGAGVARFSHRETALELYTLHAWSASLLLQASLIFRLIVELAEAKKREAALTELRYLRSVHEAGARVTHEVKNMLQSLDNLCFAALAGNENVPDDELRALVGRQLPVLSRRLRQTLERLRDPAREEMARLEPADTWWAALGQRYAHTAVEFEAVTAQGELPVLLFDQVVDNLISNALQKRDVQPGLRVVVSLAQATDGLVLSVQDSGGAIEPTVAARLFLAVMPSDTGLGIGLMQSARLADRLGYRLSLIENRSGCVRFTLARRKVSVVRSVNTQ